MLPGQMDMPLQIDSGEELKRLLAHAKQWQGEVSNLRLGGGPFNTEGLRLLLAAHVRLLEVLVEGKAETQLPTKHHA